MLPNRLTGSICVCLVLTGVASANAQTPATDAPQTVQAQATAGLTPAAEPAVPPVTVPRVSELFTSLVPDFKHLMSRQSLFLIGIGVAGSATAHSWDGNLARSGWGGEDVAEALAPGQLAGNFMMQSGGALATYVIGRTTHHARVATLGAELFRAQLLAQTTTQAVKFGTRRTRPDGTSMSFPSGHTAASFATATVLQSRFGWKAGVPAYAAASWIAASRVQSQRHYLSDVIAGATIGILAGRSVTIGYRSTKFSVAPMAAAGGLGISFVRIDKK